MKNIILFLICILVIIGTINAQHKTLPYHSSNIFQTDCLIENRGQFELLQNHVQGVKYAIQNQGDEFYFTAKGYSVKVGKRQLKAGFKEETEEDRKREEKEGKSEREREEEEMKKYENKITWLDMEWQNTNANVEIVTSEKTKHYFTYGEAKHSSYGYKTITYKNMYNGIDIVYEVHPKGGMEYTLHVHAGADLSQVSYVYKGKDVKVETTKEGLQINNEVKPIVEKEMICYYANDKANPLKIAYEVKNNEVRFVSNQALDNTKELVIDPWVTVLTTLIGTVANNMGCDVDLDVQGNLFVMGGGGASSGAGPLDQPKIAKYDVNGNLLWTFSGYVASITWAAADFSYIGNFVVDKNSGKTYVGQGFNPNTGAIAIRLLPNGTYDNYQSAPNVDFKEMWEMKINCIVGDVIAMGGTTSSDLHFNVLDTTTGGSTITNLTGISGQIAQDIANATIDNNGDVYVIFASASTTAIDNKIFKFNNNYTANIWSTFTNFTTLAESDNRSYVGFAYSNGINCLAVNNTHLFYYDGFNLECLNRTTGAIIGTPITIPGFNAKFQSGIYANDCDEVFIGGDNGNILKYQFTGTTFIPLPQITITGQANNAIFDIVYNSLLNLLYVSGDGFVATIDPVSSCPNTVAGNIQLATQIICPDLGIVTITNPVNTLSYSFIWQDSTTGVTLQNTLQPAGTNSDTLTGLLPNVTYKVTVIQSSACQIVSNVIYIKAICGGLFVYRCPGDTYTLSNGTIISTPGNYQDTLTSVGGQDSIVTITFVNYPISTTALSGSICAGQSYTLPDGSTTNVGGVFVDSFLNINGCDSIVTTTVTLHPVYSITTTASICNNQSYTLPNGTVVNTAGTYTNNFTSIYGCDSIRIVQLGVGQTSSQTVNASICANKTYTLPNNTQVSVAGTYINTIQNVSGCDSVITTNLTVNPISTSTINASICQGGIYVMPNGLPATTTGAYVNNLFKQNGCDSIITVNLTVNAITGNNTQVTICSNNPYTLSNGTTTNISGVYTDTFTNTSGCDSLVSITLDVVQLPTFNIGNDTIICKGDKLTLDASYTGNSISYWWNDGSILPQKELRAEGIYVVGITAPPCPMVKDTIQLSWKECSCKVSIPNAFTPNSDGTNDVFRPIFTCTVPLENYTMRVYNRWGEEVFMTRFQTEGWDGVFKDAMQNVGVYMYYIDFLNPITLKKEIYKGDISLVR
jgi:gliding motility-associated-like protein